VWEYGQGMAAVRQGRLDAAEQHLAELMKAAADPLWEKAFIGPQHPLSAALKVAEHMLAGELAAARKDYKKAVGALEEAVAAEDAIAYYEPPVWHQPTRPTLGAVQIASGDAAGAEKTYRQDLERNRESGWSLFGLGQALRAQKKDKEAAEVEARFAKAWAHADVKLESSRL
jgi:tetratricopeptide (TPR) repeat protein